MTRLSMNRKDRSLAFRSFFGGLVLFAVAFPLVNILFVELYALIAEGTWWPPFRERSATTAFVGHWITVLPWLVVLRRYKTWAGPHQIFRVKVRIDRRATILFLVLSGGFIAARFCGPRESSFLTTLRSYQDLWGQVWGTSITASLYIYYFFEGIIMALIMDAFQTTGESVFQKKWIPWGGVGLALTWGVSHFFTKGPSMGIAAVFFGLFVGVLFVLGKRSPWPPILAWMLNYFY